MTIPAGTSYDESVDGAEQDDDRDPLVEALKRDVDMSLLQRNLKLTPQQRIDQLIEMHRFAAELAEAGRKARARSGGPCLHVDLPTLIRLKRAAGRPKDILALAELEALLSASTK